MWKDAMRWPSSWMCRLTGLKPGQYVCQLNVVDDAGGSFAFPRFAVLVQPPLAQAVAPQTVTSSPGSGGL